MGRKLAIKCVAILLLVGVLIVLFRVNKLIHNPPPSIVGGRVFARIKDAPKEFAYLAKADGTKSALVSCLDSWFIPLTIIDEEKYSVVTPYEVVSLQRKSGEWNWQNTEDLKDIDQFFVSNLDLALFPFKLGKDLDAVDWCYNQVYWLSTSKNGLAPAKVEVKPKTYIEPGPPMSLQPKEYPREYWITIRGKSKYYELDALSSDLRWSIASDNNIDRECDTRLADFFVADLDQATVQLVFEPAQEKLLVILMYSISETSSKLGSVYAVMDIDEQNCRSYLFKGHMPSPFLAFVAEDDEYYYVYSYIPEFGYNKKDFMMKLSKSKPWKVTELSPDS